MERERRDKERKEKEEVVRRAAKGWRGGDASQGGKGKKSEVKKRLT